MTHSEGCQPRPIYLLSYGGYSLHRVGLHSIYLVLYRLLLVIPSVEEVAYAFDREIVFTGVGVSVCLCARYLKKIMAIGDEGFKKCWK